MSTQNINANTNGASRGLPYPTAGLQVIVYNKTYEDGGTTYLRTSIGVGIPLVSGTGLDAIWDFSVLSDVRFDKSNATYWGATLDAWFYYDALNPYHAKLKDFHYRFFQNQMESDNNFCFAKLIYVDGVLTETKEILIYSNEQTTGNLNRLKIHILFVINNEFYKNENITFLEDGFYLQDGYYLSDN